MAESVLHGALEPVAIPISRRPLLPQRLPHHPRHRHRRRRRHLHRLRLRLVRPPPAVCGSRHSR